MELTRMPWCNLTKLLVIAAIFAVCFAMLASVIGPGSPWLGLLLMFYFMGLAKFAEPLFMLRVPRAIHTLAPGLPDSRLYRWLGVQSFGMLLRNTALRYLNDSVYRSGGRKSLKDLLRQVESAEAIHFWGAVLFTPYIAYVWSRGYLKEAALFVVVQVLFHLYPILHLRLIRARLGRITT
jgi:Glycosyl-4,4'-diaponeurosporenoate acyltransferase